MKIENSQELEKLIKLLRKTGVESLKMGDFELKLSPDEPVSKYKQRASKVQSSDAPALSATAGLSEEDILFWSSTPPGSEPPKDS